MCNIILVDLLKYYIIVNPLSLKCRAPILIELFKNTLLLSTILQICLKYYENIINDEFINLNKELILFDNFYN